MEVNAAAQYRRQLEGLRGMTIIPDSHVGTVIKFSNATGSPSKGA